MNEQVNSNRLLNCRELSDRLSLSPRTVRRLYTEKVIPGLKVGKSLRFPQDAIEDFIETGLKAHVQEEPTK